MATRYQIEPYERRGFIYGLHCGDGAIRYVGQTLRLKARMTEHVIHSRPGAKTTTINRRLAEWITSIEVLHVALLEIDIPEADLNRLERKWIISFGMDSLLNVETNAAPIGARWDRVHGGTRKGRSMFTHQQAQEIRDRVARGETRASIARELGVHRDTIGFIAAGKTYA